MRTPCCRVRVLPRQTWLCLCWDFLHRATLVAGRTTNDHVLDHRKRGRRLEKVIVALALSCCSEETRDATDALAGPACSGRVGGLAGTTESRLSSARRTPNPAGHGGSNNVLEQHSARLTASITPRCAAMLRTEPTTRHDVDVGPSRTRLSLPTLPRCARARAQLCRVNARRDRASTPRSRSLVHEVQGLVSEFTRGVRTRDACEVF